VSYQTSYLEQISARSSLPPTVTPFQTPTESAPSRGLSAIELFAGAGGLTLGLCRANVEPIELIENNEACCETLQANASRLGQPWIEALYARDVRRVDFSQYTDIDLLAAGAPCQPFSHGGNQRGSLDERNMFPEVLRAIRETQPRAFLIENVRGLLFRRVRPYFESLLTELRSPWANRTRRSSKGKYDVDFRVLNAADFGLAQSRPRLFIVGLRKGEFKWHWPEGAYSRQSLVEALRNEDYWLDHDVPEDVKTSARSLLPKNPLRPQGQRWRTIRDLTVELGPPSLNGSAMDISHRLVDGARVYAGHTGSRFDWPAKTVKAGVHGSPGGEHIVNLDDGTHRYLTVRECACLQGFPTDYQLPEKRTPAMRQLGNAVPVALAEALGERLVEALNNGK
jgi:DNA (cytosine-5)-methyltransferase 1